MLLTVVALASTLAFQMQRLGEVARAAVVVEGRYSALFKLEHVPSAFIADGRPATGSLPRDPRGLRRLAEVRRREVRRRVDLPVPSGCSFGCQER